MGSSEEEGESSEEPPECTVSEATFDNTTCKGHSSKNGANGLNNF